MKIYITTSGDYSDYHIVGVFTDKEVADDIAGRIYDGRVETWEVNKRHPIPPNYNIWSISMLANLTCIKAEQLKDKHYQESAISRLAGKHIEGPYIPDQYYILTVAARNETHAVKIAAERLSQHLYEKQEDV